MSCRSHRFVALAAIALTSTSSDCGDSVEPQSVTSVVVTPGTSTLSAIGGTVQLSATARAEDGSVVAGKSFTWSSSDEGRASVSSTGLVTAVGNGVVTVTATTDRISGSSSVTIEQVVTNVGISPAEAELDVGETVQLSASVTDANGNVVAEADVMWESSEETVATVNQDGLVTAVAEGAATVSATSGSRSAESEITVLAPAQTALYLRIDPSQSLPDGLYLSTEPHPSSYAIFYTGTGTLTWEAFADGDFTDGSYGFSLWLGLDAQGTKNFEVSLSARRGESETTLAEATVTATRIGNCGHVTATVDGQPAVAGDKLLLRIKGLGIWPGIVCMGPTSASHVMVSGDVGVSRVTVDTLVVLPSSATIEERETVQLDAFALDATGDTLTWPEITWSSSDVSVASVEGTGLVKGEGAGTATVTAAAEGKTGTAEITVTPAPIDSMKWSFQIDGSVQSCPAIGSDGTIYFSSSQGTVYAVTPEGSERWRFSIGDDDFIGAPALATDGTVYIGADNDTLYAINPDGTRKWEFETFGEVTTSPAVASDGTIYVGSYYRFYAINPDGSEQWVWDPIYDRSMTAPVVGADGTIYLGNWARFYAINPDGSVKWDVYAPLTFVSAPAIGADGTVYASTNSHDRSLIAFNPDGTEKWHRGVGPVYTSPVIAPDGTVYVVNDTHGFYATDPLGNGVWTYATGGTRLGGPAVGADGTLYVAVSSKVWAINPDGTRRSWFETGEAEYRGFGPPTIGPDGTLYVGSSSGLYAINGDSGGLANSPWPKFMHDQFNSGNANRD